MHPSHNPVWEMIHPPAYHGLPERQALSCHDRRITFADGVSRLCATSGLWNVNLGYGNAAIRDAVAAALDDASYLSLFRNGHRYATDAARALLAFVGEESYERVLFSTSGSAANDAMMKIVRQYWAIRGEPGRMLVVGLRDSYHGQTYGSFSLTGEEMGQEAPYGADRRAIRHVAHETTGELADLLEREGDRVAAVVVEPLLGTGAHELDGAFVDGLLRLRERYGFLLVADEVATGFGRTGPAFASREWAAAPDVLVSSKGLTNGTCGASAVIVSGEIRRAFDGSGSILVHGETQGGAPSSCAAIMATIAEFERGDVVARGRRLGERLDATVRRLAAHPLVSGYRGRGCFRALVLDVPGFPGAEAVPLVTDAVRMRGAIVYPGPDCVQLVPALTYTDAELEELEVCVRAGLDACLA